MTRILQRLPAAFMLLALTAFPARAGVEQGGLGGCGNCTLPTLIRLVGSSAGIPDTTAGKFTVIVRDIAANPMAHATVVVSLEDCPDLALCADQLDPNAVTNCAAKLVRKLTDASGAVTFTILGHANGAGNAASLLNAGHIYVFGTGVAAPTVAAFDLDGSGGLGADDLSAWLTDFGTGENFGRSDYDGSGTVGAADLSEWLTVFGAGGSTQSCGASCP